MASVVHGQQVGEHVKDGGGGGGQGGDDAGDLVADGVVMLINDHLPTYFLCSWWPSYKVMGTTQQL